eukprot:TRINITY_DN1979_c1_g1_i2.p1 TRINITY_DN1979_c1_g1~~TRINITY_DN1979_c1_g1_i2.p1  ORF type:complete len:364 (+),score=59.39 TRINITY_DN1979_c1_g1_i2:858-1949(+)
MWGDSTPGGLPQHRERRQPPTEASVTINATGVCGPGGCAGHCDASGGCALRAATDLFMRRLLRREHRATPLHKVEKVVTDCVRDFRGLVASALEHGQSGLSVGDWECWCDKFSIRWKKVCHPTCPARLAEFLSAYQSLSWAGGREVRRGPPLCLPAHRRSRQQAGEQAQPHICVECGVVCNSKTQALTHLRGRRHVETVARLAREAAHVGKVFSPQPPQPLRTADRHTVTAICDEDIDAALSDLTGPLGDPTAEADAIEGLEQVVVAQPAAVGGQLPGTANGQVGPLAFLPGGGSPFVCAPEVGHAPGIRLLRMACDSDPTPLFGGVHARGQLAVGSDELTADALGLRSLAELSCMLEDLGQY